MIAVNILFVPKYGYMACAWGGFAGYGTTMLLSYCIGQKKYPVHYELRTMALFTLMALAIYLLNGLYSAFLSMLWSLAVSAVMLLIFAYLIYKELKK